MRFVRVIYLSFALLASAHEAIGSTPAASANKDQWRAAQKLFDAADELYDAGKYSEAVTAYRASYDIVASPNSRLMIARALAALGRFTLAHDELERTIIEAEAIAKHDAQYAQTAAAARAELAALSVKTGQLSIVLAGGMEDAAVTINDVQIPKPQLARPIFLAPGRLIVSARAADGRVARKELELMAGSRQTVELTSPVLSGSQPDASEAASNGGKSRTALLWTSAGLGAAGGITFAVFGVLNNQKLGELESSCPEGRCPSDPADAVRAGKRYQLIANVGLGVGVLGLGAAATLWLVGRDAGPQANAALPQLRLSERSAQLDWQGRF